MLFNLHIENIALIDNLELTFENGLNVLTGETGAGKSIIIDSINVLLGQRASRELIKTGTDKALVEALIFIENKDVVNIINNEGIKENEDNSIILSREIFRSGRNVCRINGRVVTLSQLRKIGENLVSIHGQHESKDLVDIDKHIEFLDSFAGDELINKRKEYYKLYCDLIELRKKIEALSKDDREKERRIDLLNFQINEIDGAKLKTDEEEVLDEQIKKMSNYEELIKSVSESYDLLYSSDNMRSSAYDNISKAVERLSAASEIDEKLLDKYNTVLELSCQLEEVSRDICNYRDSLDYDPGLLDELQQRMDVIYNLKRKYGGSIEEILKYRDTISEELEEISTSEEQVKKYKDEYKNKEIEMHKIALQLSEMRKKKAILLEKKIMKELKELNMNKTIFKVAINNTNTDEGIKYNKNGMEHVEFMISTNPGEPLKPLIKIASGGELSRIMLAIKNILSDVDDVETLIFDEIDNGISGQAAQKVAEKLYDVSCKKQVLCITHLAQIASFADNHYLISKYSKLNSTKTKVKKLEGNDREKEIARIIGGAQITNTTLNNSKELIEMASSYKNRE